MVVKRGRVSFLLLLASLMMASSASLASDFVTGLVVGQALSNNNGSTKQGDDAQGDKEFVDFNAAQEVTSKEVWFQSKQWRREEWPDGQSRYFICPGNGEFRSYSGRYRCRVADTGFSGFMGGMKDAKELPLAEALAAKEGKPITLESLKIESRQLAVKYFIVPVKQTPVKIEAAGGSAQLTHNLEQGSSGQATTSAPVEVEKKPQGLNSQNVTSAPDFFLEWLDSPSMKIIILVFTVAGVGHSILRGNINGALLFIPMAFFPTVAKMLFFTGELTETPATPDSGGGEGAPIFLVGITAACVIAFFVYRYYADRVAEERLETLLRLNRAAAQSSPPVSRNNEPPTIDILRERQQQDNTSEPVVVSSSAATSRVPRDEPEDVQPGKRKIILD
ncbi:MULTISPECIES: hypothetical protein [Aeromonas]|uniref:Uncharacterized protein n=1 Tax=Aeromonas salmonicida TaxID=645 RepID=A0AAX1PFA6_AERSA|nr:MULTISPECIES: hypothetical protein [Aeromonas]MDU4190101.1 hypothetical protein [Aeromonas sp.]RAI97623.1 hypothetical protein DEU50_13723 [Aeromonas salmonicida]